MKQSTIEQIKQEQSTFTDLWNLYKKYAGIQTEREWVVYLAETQTLFEKYKDTECEYLYRGMLGAITKRLEENCLKNIE